MLENLKLLLVFCLGLVVATYMSLMKTGSCMSLSEYTSADLMWELWRRYQWLIIGISAYLGLTQAYLFYRVARWFFRGAKKYVEVVTADAAAIVGSVNPLYVPEKHVEGSEYFPHKRPGFVVDLFSETKPGTWTYVGVGWRILDYLVTAHHVVAGLDLVRIKVDDKYVDVDGTRFEGRGADCAVVVLSNVDWTTLSVKSAKLPKMALSSNRVVFAHSRGSASSGMLSPYHVFPYVVYEGSTRPGFSGSPLHVGNTVFAMHVGAGKINMALDSNWIKAMLFKPEDTDDWIYEEIERTVARTGNKVKYRMLGPGEAYILSNGKYHALDIQDLPDRVASMLEYEPPKSMYAGENAAITPNVIYNDRPLNLKGASAIAEAQRLKSDELAPPQTNVEVILPSSSRMQPVPTSMDGPESTLAQLSRALDTISQLRAERPSSVRMSRGLAKRRMRYRSVSKH